MTEKQRNNSPNAASASPTTPLTLITGATGLLGGEIARQLVRGGKRRLRVLHRAGSRLDGLKDLDCERVIGDLGDPDSLRQGMKGATEVIHVAGCVSPKPAHAGRLHAINVTGTANVMQAAKEAHAGGRGTLRRVVHTSSIVAVGATTKPVLQDEATPWVNRLTRYDYITTKRAGEQVALEYAAAGLPVVVLNPGLILGPGDVYGTSTRVVTDFVRGKIVACPGGGIAICDVRDVAAAHVSALTRGRAGERYILGGHNLGLRDLLAQVAQLAGKRKPLPLPEPAAASVGWLCEQLARVTRHPYDDLSRDFILHTYRFAYFDCSKAKTELGYRVRPLVEMLKDTLSDAKARGLIPG